MRIIVAIMCGLCVLILCAPGCDSKKQRREESMIQTPLVLDPTEPIELSRWWSNGQELLLLDVDGAYSILQGPGRTSAELQRGRWSQQNYATLWLEPYSAQSTDRVRVTITKRGNGSLALLVPRFADFTPIASPPVTLEDRVIGKWLGSMGELRVMANRRYELVPAARPDDADRGLPPLIQRGTWSIAGNDLSLQPDTRGAAAMNLAIVVDQNHIALNAPGNGGLFTRAK